MTVRDVEGLLRLFTYLMLLYPVSNFMTAVLVSRHERKHFMKWLEVYGPTEWRLRMAWRDRKIERLQDDVTERDSTIHELRIAAEQQQRTLNKTKDKLYAD